MAEKLIPIARIEGHANLFLDLDAESIPRVRMEVFEAARFFEHLIVGRHFSDVPFLISRICGICCCIQKIAAITAIEDALGIGVSERIDNLRSLMCIGERIRSHITHLFFLALPDYLGYDSAFSMIAEYREKIEQALKLINLGNDIITVIGGREIHPISAVIGGFSEFPTTDSLNKLKERLKAAEENFVEIAEFFRKITTPSLERKTLFLSIEDYRDSFTSRGKLIIGRSVYVERKDYRAIIDEQIEPYSTAEFASIKGKSYRVGSLARMMNHREFISPAARESQYGGEADFQGYNPFSNNLCQAIELLENCRWAIEILENIEIGEEKIPDFRVRAGKGLSAVEAPRGTLFHEYEINDTGEIARANILTPTAQNLRAIEEDATLFASRLKDNPREEIEKKVIMLVRSYDPCISCSTH